MPAGPIQRLALSTQLFNPKWGCLRKFGVRCKIAFAIFLTNNCQLIQIFVQIIQPIVSKHGWVLNLHSFILQKIHNLQFLCQPCVARQIKTLAPHLNKLQHFSPFVFISCIMWCLATFPTFCKVNKTGQWNYVYQKAWAGRGVYPRKVGRRGPPGFYNRTRI